MKSSRSKIYSLAALALAAVFLYLALRNVRWSEVQQVVANGKPSFLLLAFVMAMVGLNLRVYRWVLITRSQPGEKLVSYPVGFWAYAVGAMGNNLFPARAGDFLRAVITGQKTRFSTGQALATVVTERVLDSILLLIVGAAALLGIQSFRETLPALAAAVVLVVIGFIAAVFLYGRFSEPIQRWCKRFPLPFIGWDKLFGFADRFIDGFRVLRSPAQVARILALSFAIWAYDALITMALSYAFEINLNFFQALTLLSALGLSSALPATPGYVGVYQFVAVAVMAPFGVAESRALVHILAFQLSGYLVTFLWGGLGLWRLKIGFDALSRSRAEMPAINED